MSYHGSQEDRIRRMLSGALDGNTYESAWPEEDRALVMKVSKPDGRLIAVRFLGLKESESSAEPEVGSPVRLRGVGGTEAWIARVLVPRVLRPPAHAVRVRIEAGAARLEIVCEDVEWWEESAPDQHR
jgi:hypothetical protein